MTRNTSQRQYHVYAIKYADSPKRSQLRNFLNTRDLHDAPMPMDFFIWVAISGRRVILIDSGCSADLCQQKGYRFIRTPVAALELLGLKPEQVTDLIVSHLHWDHAGNVASFPNARIIVQEFELAHATGPAMCHSILRTPYDIDQVCEIVRTLYAGRIQFNHGDLEIAPGVTAHLMGGHTPGLQVVRINTQRGNIVLASDAVHFYANAIFGNPFPVLVDMKSYLDAFNKVALLADSPQHIIAGHDPIVAKSFPIYDDRGNNDIVCLDRNPIQELPDITERRQ